MQILGPNATKSTTAFIIAPGKQITLHASGLTGLDTVAIEILELSAAPPFNGNPCCNLEISKIEVIRRIPLLCPDGKPVLLTADFPYGVIDTPQGVALGVTLHASPSAVVTVSAEESDSDGCMSCICDRPCVDDVWTTTGEFRCNGAVLEALEESNCGTSRWVASGLVAWTDTGEFRCVGTNIEKQQENNCKDTRWVAAGPQTWVATGDTRCNNNLVENEEVNDCGKTRWTTTTTVCGFCASYSVPRGACDGQSAYTFREGDARDPLATVRIEDCDGGNVMYAYPTAGPGHSVALTDCDGNIIGYGANTSACASGETTHIEIGALPDLRIKFMSTLKISEMPKLEISALPVIEIARHVVSAVQIGNEVWTYWSDGTKTVEVLPTPKVPVVYCPSVRLNGGGFGYHELDSRDPAATVLIAPCTGDTSVDPIYIYPTAAPGRTARQNDCDGNLIGYGANTSNCAPDCGCAPDNPCN